MAARSPRPLADETRLLACLPNARLRDQVLVLPGLRTGFRAAELDSLVLGQVRQRDGGIAGHVTVERARRKGSGSVHRRAVRNRTVPLVESARALFGRFLAQRSPCDPAAALFPSRTKGLLLTPGQINRIVQRHLLGAGVAATYLCSHALRKSFAGRIYAETGNDLLATHAAWAHSAYIGTMEARTRQTVLAIYRPLALVRPEESDCSLPGRGPGVDGVSGRLRPLLADQSGPQGAPPPSLAPPPEEIRGRRWRFRGRVIGPRFLPRFT